MDIIGGLGTIYNMKKLFVIQKYIVASSIKEAIKIDKLIMPDEIWLDEDWKKANKPKIKEVKIGFTLKNKQ